MKLKVMYYSRKGNTKKVAEAMANALGQTAEALPPAYPLENVGLLYLGVGVYMGTVDKKVEEFIRTLNTNRVKNVVVFGTSGSQDKAIKKTQELLREKGINVVDDTFMCKGKFLFMHRKHPTDKELGEAGEFAKKIVARLDK
jgi:flavodoxin